MSHLVPSILFVVLAYVYLVYASCTHPIYCNGPILEAVQNAAVFSDSKTFVDMPLKVPVEQVQLAFSQLPQGYNMSDFVNEYFDPAGSDLVSVVPDDWSENPPLFAFINDSQVLELAKYVNSKWLDLVREFNNSYCTDCYSHISVSYPFVIAGSRFREYYYWDTYWSLEGLLISGMFDTALGMVKNFLGLVQQFGFVPNGGRIYYLNRSQPPMLIQMVRLYLAYDQDNDFLAQALPILDMEYSFWMTNNSVQLDSNSILNRYYVTNSYPRPESYLNDVTTAANLDEAAKEALYQQLATTAESGWDFSTRWMSNPPDLTSLTTTNIIPVDLNCILYANELTLADMHETTGNITAGSIYRAAAANRLAAIQRYLWSESSHMWNDYNTATQQQTRGFYASQFVPFWSGVYQVLPHDDITAVIQNLLPVFQYAAGVPASLNNSGQQWDFPNGWAPLQYWVIEGFKKVISDPKWEDPVVGEQVSALSTQLAKKWITTNYCVMKKYDVMFEKYDVEAIGTYGSGGEYTVQDGFGWTNGVAFRLISDYAATLTVGSCDDNIGAAALIGANLLVVILVVVSLL